MMVGDLLALSAAGKIAEKRLHEMCQKFGMDALMETFGVLFERARETMRRLIRSCRRRQFGFEDCLDNDGIIDEPLTIAIAMTRDRRAGLFDFTGTSPQCEGPMNYPINPSMIKLELYNVLKMAAGERVEIDADLDPNQGIEDLVDVIMPEGCFLAPVVPGAGQPSPPRPRTGR